MRTPPSIRPLAALVALIIAAPAHSISDDQVFGGLQINFANPGARSLALAGATLAMSEDGTAAFTNPAALMALSNEQGYLEVRNNDFDIPYIVNATDAGPVEEDSSSSSTGLSFLSFSSTGNDWAFGVYAHQLADFNSRVDRSAISFRSGLAIPNFSGTTSTADNFRSQAESTRFVGAKSDINLEIRNIGLSIAKRVGDKVSLGFGIANSNFDLSAMSAAGSGNAAQTYFVSGKDNDTTYSLGLTVNFTPNWTGAFTYRTGGDFNFNYDSPFGDSQKRFSVPDIAGLGLAYSSDDGLLRIGFDAIHVAYSDLTDQYEPGQLGSSEADLNVNDGWELRLGAERTFLVGESQWSLRAGIWRDPDHQVTASADRAAEACAARFPIASEASALARNNGLLSRFRCEAGSEFVQTLFPEGNDELHFSGGLGFSYKSFAASLGADFSDLIDVYSVTINQRF